MFWLFRLATFGLGTRCQAVPFQCSISVCVTLPGPVRIQPTAQASRADVAATPVRKLKCLLSVGLGTSFQALPFQCSINVEPWPWFDTPTAQALAREVAAT